MEGLAKSSNAFPKNTESQKDIIQKSWRKSIQPQIIRELITITSTNKDVGPGNIRKSELRFLIDKEKNQSQKHSLIMYNSHPPSTSPLCLSIAPLSGHYKYKSVTDEILAQKKIGKKGVFFSNRV